VDHEGVGRDDISATFIFWNVVLRLLHVVSEHPVSHRPLLPEQRQLLCKKKRLQSMSHSCEFHGNATENQCPFPNTNNMDVNWWPAGQWLPVMSFYAASGKVSRMWICSLVSLLSKRAELSDLQSKSSVIIAYVSLNFNFLFTSFNCLATCVISGQTVTNDHFGRV
jgi:hypothetical protein